jgi:hypothetical protein
MSEATPDERYHLITRRLQEVLGGDTIKTLLAQGKTPKCYWGMCSPGSHILILPRRADRKLGTAPTGRRE